MAYYNVNKIENLYNDFSSIKRKFKNNYLNGYNSSYIKKGNNDVTNSINRVLESHYNKISRIYDRIDKYWSEFLNDVKNTDLCIAGQAGAGSVKASSVSSLLSSLPNLQEYSADLGLRIKSISGDIGTAKVVEWSEDRDFLENLKNSADVFLSTAAVIATSVKSGVAKLKESLLDGVLWLGTAAVTGVATLFGEEEWANKVQNTMMDVIDFDIVGKVNEALYENTSIGRSINEKSIIKYDSEVAQHIQSASTKVYEFALATALTIVTGGAASPFVTPLVVGGTGFLIGAGDKAEENFSKEDRDFWGDSGEITLAAGIKALEFYSEGQMGDTILSGIGAIKSVGGIKNFLGGIKTVLSNGQVSFLTKEALKNGFKATITDVDTYMDSIGAALDNITYDKENGIQIDWKGLAKETACNFAMNFVFGFSGSVLDTKMTSGMEKITASSKKINNDVNIDSLKGEYDELLKKSKEPWFVNAKEAMDNGYAWNLKDIDAADKTMKRMSELESIIKNNSQLNNTASIQGMKFATNNSNNVDSLKREYDELISWRSSDKFKRDEAYWRTYGDKIGGNPYKKNMDRLSELEGILKGNSQLNGIKNISANINTNSVKNVNSFLTPNHIVNDVESQIKNSNEMFESAIRFDNDSDIAMYFDDPKQYLYKKLRSLAEANDPKCIKKINEINAPYRGNKAFKSCPSVDLNEKEIYNFLNQNGYLTQKDINVYSTLKRFDGYSETEKAAIFCFTKWSGPNLSAYNRHTDINYNGTIINGANNKAVLDNTNLGIRTYNKFYKTNIPEFKSMDEFNSVIDEIVGKQKLKNDIIVYRTVDDLFFDGKKLDLNDLKPGDIFNDPAHTSASVKKVGFQKNSKRKIQLEICAKEGTSAAYIESFTGVSGYSQQEILFGRNSSYKIIGYPKIDTDGVYHIKVELLDGNKYIPNVKSTSDSTYAKLFNKTHKEGKKVPQIINSMQQNGMMKWYNKEVDDIMKQGLYDGPKAIAEHDLTHVKNVLLYTMNMGNDMKLSDKEMSMLVDCAKYHDVGVVNARTHTNHAVLSAEKMGKNLTGKYDDNTLKKMQAIVEFHEQNDIKKLNTGEYVSDDSALKAICGKYGITEKSDVEQIKSLGSILKDADALDRTRFPGNIDTNYFRNKETALEYLNASYDIRESISSADLYQRLKSGNYSADVINEVVTLVNKGYPEAVVDFGLKYYDRYNCTSIKEYVEKAMRTTR